MATPSGRAGARSGREWLPYLSVPAAYAVLGRLGGRMSTRAHVQPQLAFDELLFGGTASTVALQRARWDPDDPRWWDFAAWLVYLSHFVVTVAVALALWFVDPRRFRRWRRLVLATTFAGFATYLTYPALPPWLASIRGHLPRTDRVMEVMWGHLGAPRVAAIFGQHSKLAFEVGALPSLHAATPFLAMLFFWSSAPAWRPVTVAYTLAMALTLVYTADHFVLDILLGWAYAAVAHALLT